MGRPLVAFTHLLDTATLIWFISDPRRLTSRAFDICGSGITNPAVSVVSLMEMVVKANKGKLLLEPDPIHWWNRNVEGAGFKVLPLLQHHVECLWKLPALHHDPADRLLIAQSIAEGLPLVTPDNHIRQYPVEVIW